MVVSARREVLVVPFVGVAEIIAHGAFRIIVMNCFRLYRRMTFRVW